MLSRPPQRIPLRVEEKRWECFQLNYFQEIPGTEVATIRLSRMLSDEFARIESA